MRSQWARRRSSGSATIYLTASATVRRVPPSFVGSGRRSCLREVTVVQHRERVLHSRPETRPVIVGSTFVARQGGSAVLRRHGRQQNHEQRQRHLRRHKLLHR